jgi:hypothetical protein
VSTLMIQPCNNRGIRPHPVRLRYGRVLGHGKASRLKDRMPSPGGFGAADLHGFFGRHALATNPLRMGVSPASGFPPNLLQKAELQFPEGPLEPGGPLRFEGPLIGSPRTFAGRPQSPICCIPGGSKLISAKAQARLCSEQDYRSALGSNSWIGSTGLMAVMVCL